MPRANLPLAALPKAIGAAVARTKLTAKTIVRRRRFNVSAPPPPPLRPNLSRRCDPLRTGKTRRDLQSESGESFRNASRAAAAAFARRESQ